MFKHLFTTGGTDSINALAGALGRPYRRVHDDVMALLDAGLLERSGTRILPIAGGAVARIDFLAQAS